MTINDFITYWGDSSNYRCVNTSGIEITGHVLPIRDIYDAANGTDTAKQLRLEDVAWLVENWQRVLNIMTQGETSPRITISPALTATHLESVRAFLNDVLNNGSAYSTDKLVSCSKIGADDSVVCRFIETYPPTSPDYSYDKLLATYGMSCDYLRSFGSTLDVDNVRRMFYGFGNITNVIGKWFYLYRIENNDDKAYFYTLGGIEMYDWQGGHGVEIVSDEGQSRARPYSVGKFTPCSHFTAYSRYLGVIPYVVADTPLKISLHKSFNDLVSTLVMYVPYSLWMYNGDNRQSDYVHVQSVCPYVETVNDRPVFSFPSHINDTRDAFQFATYPAGCFSTDTSWMGYTLAIELNLRNDFAGIGWAYTPS